MNQDHSQSHLSPANGEHGGHREGKRDSPDHHQSHDGAAPAVTSPAHDEHAARDNHADLAGAGRSEGACEAHPGYSDPDRRRANAPWGIVLQPAVGAIFMSLSTVMVAVNAQSTPRAFVMVRQLCISTVAIMPLSS